MNWLHDKGSRRVLWPRWGEVCRQRWLCFVMQPNLSWATMLRQVTQKLLIDVDIVFHGLIVLCCYICIRNYVLVWNTYTWYFQNCIYFKQCLLGIIVRKHTRGKYKLYHMRYEMHQDFMKPEAEWNLNANQTERNIREEYTSLYPSPVYSTDNAISVIDY